MTMVNTASLSSSLQSLNLKKQQDHQTLTNIIVEWNASRLDLFELTMPNENLEFSGNLILINDYLILNYNFIN